MSLSSTLTSILLEPGDYFFAALLVIGVVVGWILWFPRHTPPFMRALRGRPDPDGDAYSRVYSSLNQNKSSLGIAYLSYQLDSAVVRRTGQHPAQLHTFWSRFFRREEIDDAGVLRRLSEEIDQAYRSALRLEALELREPRPKREIRRLSRRLKQKIPRLVERTNAAVLDLSSERSELLRPAAEWT
ncbi:MAG: hypothetical protein WB778_01235 [Thermoplasmata archaeon]